MKTVKCIFNILLILLCVVFQTGFLFNFGFLSNLDLILCLTIYFVLFDYPLALMWIFIGGFLLNFYSILPFGTYVLIFLIMAFIIRYLLKNFFSQRSFYSLIILVFLSFLIYEVELVITTNLFYWLKIIDLHIILDKAYFIAVMNHLFLDILISGLFIVIFKFSKKKKLSL